MRRPGLSNYTTGNRSKLGSFAGRRAVLGALGIDCPEGCMPIPKSEVKSEPAPKAVAPQPQRMALPEADWTRSSGVVASRTKAVPANFDEDAYLNKHPDVANAVENGIMPSGLWHYMKYGRNEGRALAGWSRQRPGNLSGIDSMWRSRR